MVPRQSEAEVTKAIRSWLKTRGIVHFKAWQGPMSQPGVSDIVGLLPDGRFLAVEVKHEGWKPPGPRAKAYKHYHRQSCFLKDVNRSGGVGFFAASLDEAIQKLRPHLTRAGVPESPFDMPGRAHAG
jgi:hypothetical protein